jgi:DNA polymerase-3 subunit gamma/tau
VSHLALARKYRPQRFADLVGQDAIRATLERAVAGNRVAHAYLFAGPRGSGKTTTARLIAKALNCANRQAGQGEPCDECPSCREIAAGTSMDVLEIDGASNRGIEEIRNLRENVKYAASGGKFKVYIIDEAHQLTDHAWNALLKTLEEPPVHVRFVFATTQPLDVPDTIASRCQVFDFRRLRSGELVTHLLAVAAKEKVALDQEAAALIARASEGSVRDALGRLDQALALAPDGVTAATVSQALGLAGLDAYFDLGAAVAARNPGRALEVLDRLHDSGMDVEEIAAGLTHHLRQLLLLAVDPTLEHLVDAAPSDRERYASQASAFRGPDLSAMLSLLLETRGVLRRSEAPRILLEVCLVELCTMPQAGQVEALIRRLGDVEARLAGGAGGPPSAGGSQASGEARKAAPQGPTEERRPLRFSSLEAADVPPRGATPTPSTRLLPQEQPPAVITTAEAPAIEPLAGDEQTARWRQAVDRVKERKLLLGTCLEEGAFLGLAGSRVRVALLPEHAFHRAMLEMKENQAILNEELERLYGRGAALLCEVASQARTERALRDATGVAASDAARDPRPAEPAAAGEPAAGMVQRIVELFDGEVLAPGTEGGAA